MKKNYLFNNTNRILILMGITVITWLSSCKDTSPGAVNFGDSPALVGFQYYGFNAVPIQTKVHGIANDSTNVEVALSVASIVLKTTVTATVATDAADGATYAAAQTAAGDTTFVVPSTDYTIANGGNVTFTPGKMLYYLKLNIKGNLINFNNPDYTYIIPLKLVSSSGAIIATNLNVAYLQLTLQSVYEGDYSDNGFDLRIVNGAQDPVDGGNFTGYDSPMPTVNANTVGFTVLWANDTDAGGVGGTTLTVNPATNQVTVASSGNSTLTNAPGYNNHYDPIAKKFYISFVWSTPGTRASTDTLTYKGPL